MAYLSPYLEECKERNKREEHERRSSYMLALLLEQLRTYSRGEMLAMYHPLDPTLHEVKREIKKGKHCSFTED